MNYIHDYWFSMMREVFKQLNTEGKKEAETTVAL